MTMLPAYTYRHNTTRDLLAPFEVSDDFVFSTEEACREFVARCLDHLAPEYVIVEGEWADGTFTGIAVTLSP